MIESLESLAKSRPFLLHFNISDTLLDLRFGTLDRSPTPKRASCGEEPPSVEAASEMGRSDPDYSSKLDSEEGETKATTSSFTIIWLGHGGY